MAKFEHIRESWMVPPDAEYWTRKGREGWKLVAIEWKRELATGESGASRAESYEVPYGLRIASDCLHLEEHPVERQVLLLMLESIVQDQRLSQVSDLLNERGFRTREGKRWSPGSVFDQLPRLVEAGPALLTSGEWVERRGRLMALL